MSDVVLAREIGEYRDSGELRRGGYRIVPNTLEAFALASTIPVYFEVYNLAFDREGRTRYRVSFELESLETSSGASKFLKRLAGRYKPPRRVVSAYRLSGASRQEPVVQNLELRNPSPGAYRLRVLAVDELSGSETRKERTFLLEIPSR